MKNLLGAAAILAAGMFAVSGTANAAPIAPDAAGLATLAQTKGTELVHWRFYRHCHGRGYRRYCHGGFRKYRHRRHYRRYY
jgi:hypothetical protein